MVKKVLFFSYLVVIIVCWSCSSSNDCCPERIIGVKVYQPKSDYNNMFSEWKKLKINTAFISKELLKDSVFNCEASNRGIKRFLIAPVFYNPEALTKNPEWWAITNTGQRAKQDWVEFICPTQEEYISALEDSLKTLVRVYKPDGLSIDFIRYFAFWEMVDRSSSIKELPQSCYCEHCQEKFYLDNGISRKITSAENFAKWIAIEHNDIWLKWRIENVSGVFKRIANAVKSVDSSVIVNLHAVPWLQGERENAILDITAQDVSQIASMVDYVSPMCYHYMVHESPSWVKTVLEGLDDKANGKILPSIQVGNAYRETKLPNEDFEKALKFALEKPSRGVVFWSWEYLEKEPDKIKLAIDILSQN